MSSLIYLRVGKHHNSLSRPILQAYLNEFYINLTGQSIRQAPEGGSLTANDEQIIPALIKNASTISLYERPVCTVGWVTSDIEQGHEQKGTDEEVTCVISYVQS